MRSVAADHFVLDRDAKTGKPRLWQKTAIEHDGNVIGGADSSSVLPGDFIQPLDECTQPPISVTFESLDLFAADDSLEPTPGDDSVTLSTDRTETTDLPSIQTYSGMMRFSVELDEEGRKEIDIAISHDVQFVTAHPCVPPPPSDILRSPTSPSFQTLEVTPVAATSPMTSRGTLLLSIRKTMEELTNNRTPTSQSVHIHHHLPLHAHLYP